jgi:hypothetical protein
MTPEQEPENKNQQSYTLAEFIEDIQILTT